MPTPDDSNTHIIGAGALGYYGHWLSAIGLTVGDDGPDSVRPDWHLDLVCEDGNGGTVKVTVNHQVILKAMREVVRTKPASMGAHVVSECRTFLRDPEDADFDAEDADQLLQYIVLGEVIFG